MRLIYTSGQLMSRSQGQRICHSSFQQHKRLKDTRAFEMHDRDHKYEGNRVKLGYVLWVVQINVLGSLGGVEKVLVVSCLLHYLGSGGINAFPVLVQVSVSVQHLGEARRLAVLRWLRGGVDDHGDRNGGDRSIEADLIRDQCVSNRNP